MDDSLRFVNFVKTGEDVSGRTYYQAKHIADSVGDSVGHLLKELEAYNQGSRAPQVSMALKAAKLWRTSVVTGLVVPRPLYFVNNLAGDVSQIWHEMGLAQSARTNMQFVAGIPWYSQRLYGYRKFLREKLGTEAVLPDLGSALFNPTTARAFNGEKFWIRTSRGEVIQSTKLLEDAIETGVMDSMANAELLKQLTKIGKGGNWDGIRALKGWQDDMSELASYVQQRQRFSLFGDLRRQGYTKEAAAQKVLDSIYDWKNGISEWEARWAASLIPFYRFWRLALGQQLRLVLEPLVKPTFGKKGALLKALTGQTAGARTRQQYLALSEMSSFIDPTIQAEYQDTQSLMQEMGEKMNRADWLGHARGSYGWSKLDPSVADYYADLRGVGRPVTHTISSTGPFTAIETGSLLASFFQGTAAAMITTLPSKYVGVFDEGRGDFLKRNLNPNWMSNFYNQPIEMLYPVQKDLVKFAMATAGYDRWTGYAPGRMRLKGNEAWLIENTNLMLGLDDTDITADEYGRKTAPALPLMLWRMAPGFQEGAIFSDRMFFENPEMRKYADTRDGKDLAKGLQSFLGRHSGLSIPGTEIKGQRYPISAPMPMTTLGEQTPYAMDDAADPAIPAQMARRQMIGRKWTKILAEKTEADLQDALQRTMGAKELREFGEQLFTPEAVDEQIREELERRAAPQQRAGEPQKQRTEKPGLAEEPTEVRYPKPDPGSLNPF